MNLRGMGMSKRKHKIPARLSAIAGDDDPSPAQSPLDVTLVETEYSEEPTSARALYDLPAFPWSHTDPSTSVFVSVPMQSQDHQDSQDGYIIQKQSPAFHAFTKLSSLPNRFTAPYITSQQQYFPTGPNEQAFLHQEMRTQAPPFTYTTPQAVSYNDALWVTPRVSTEGDVYSNRPPHGEARRPADPSDLEQRMATPTSEEDLGRFSTTSTQEATEMLSSLDVSQGESPGIPPVAELFGQSSGGYLQVPRGYFPVLIPSSISPTSDIMVQLGRLGAVIPRQVKTPTQFADTTPSASSSPGYRSPQITTSFDYPVYNMQKPRKAPRPANSFILYRREKQDFVMKTHDGITNNEASRIIGEMWAKEPDEVKAVYKQKAEEAKRLHMAAYPDYKYAPRKPNKNKKQSSEPSASNNLNQTTATDHKPLLEGGLGRLHRPSMSASHSVSATDEDSPIVPAPSGFRLDDKNVYGPGQLGSTRHSTRLMQEWLPQPGTVPMVHHGKRPMDLGSETQLDEFSSRHQGSPQPQSQVPPFAPFPSFMHHVQTHPGQSMPEMRPLQQFHPPSQQHQHQQPFTPSSPVRYENQQWYPPPHTQS